MADIIDQADHQAEMIREKQIEAARTGGAYMPGPVNCIRCGYKNDRQELGYGVCSDCDQELTGATIDED